MKRTGAPNGSLLALVVGAAIAVAVPTWAATPAESAAAKVADGKAAFAAGDHAAAYKAFLEAAKLDPKHPTAMFNAALSARKAGLMREAGDAYRAVLARDPKDLDVVFGLAEVERTLGNADAARALYTRYLAEEKRPERQELRGRAESGLAALPPTTATAPTPAIDKPADVVVSAQRQADAEALVQEGIALVAAGNHKLAATRFTDAVGRDPNRVDALLKAGLAHRRTNAFDNALAAYGQAVGHPKATAEQRLDGSYGLGETLRLKGDRLAAIEHFERYIAGERRPTEARFVERAKQMVQLLRGELSAVAAAPTPAVPTPTPPTPTATPTPPAAPTPAAPPPVVVAVAAPPPPVTPAVDLDALLDGAVLARLDASASPSARAALGAKEGPARAGPCDADALLASAEVSLAAKDAARARAGFARARACDPTRSAPLWGLSRAADLAGDAATAKHLARQYLVAAGPDQDKETASAALWRAEQP